MARIPLQVAQRSLDTGNVVSYPSGSPLGGAIEGFGDTLQAVAEQAQQRQDRKDAFAQDVLENEFTSAVAGLEDETIRNAPADGSGLHDSIYGEMSPNGGVVKPGAFDALFDGYAERMPESKRQEFLAKREAYRLKGSTRVAGAQYKAEQAWYGVQIQKTQQQLLNSIAQSPAEDYEAFKSQGLSLIDKSGLPELEKEVARANWEATAAEGLFKARLAQDPAFAEKARASLGLAPRESSEQIGAGGALGLLRKFEGFRETPYWDVNALRTGYGSDTVTRADGTVERVGPNTRVTRADAERDLARRARDFESAAASKVGIDAWSRLPEHARAALVSVAYNYGSLPGSVAAAVKGGNVEQVAAAVEGLSGHNGGVNANRRREEAAVIRGEGRVPAADPVFDGIPLDRRLVLANQADVQVSEIQRQALATMKAEYTSHKDSIELQIVQGQVRDEAVVSNDPILNDGDKATLIGKVRTQNEGANRIAADLTALDSNSLNLNPYMASDRKRADDMFADAAKRLNGDQQAALAGAIIQQTGIVPAPVIASLRQGLAATNPAEVALAAQTAARIAATQPSALGAREGGGEVQTAADDFSYYVNRLNLSPDEAARKLIDARDPQKQRDRKALEPAAKEFTKSLDDYDLPGLFNETWVSADPALGFTPAQEFGLKAEFKAIAEDQFFRANGDPEIAKARAEEEIKRLYGATGLTGKSVVMKHPPERYWPALKFSGYGRTIVRSDSPSLDYATFQLRQDMEKLYPDLDMDRVQLVTTPETDAMVKRGEMPGYGVLYQDENGVYQTIPGKLWKPDVEAMQADQQAREEASDAEAESAARAQQRQNRQAVPFKVQTQDDFLSGNDPAFGARDAR